MDGRAWPPHGRPGSAASPQRALALPGAKRAPEQGRPRPHGHAPASAAEGRQQQSAQHGTPEAPEHDPGKCVLCGLGYAPNVDTMQFGACKGTAHMLCYMKLVHCRYISTCPSCVPVGSFSENFGDCIYTNHIHLEAEYERNLRAALGQRHSDYTPEIMLEHALELFKFDTDAESESGVAKALVQHVQSLEPRPLQPWLPGFDSASFVRAKLAAHTRPFVLRQENVNAIIIMNCRVTFDDLIAWKYTLSEIHDLGFGLRELCAIGFRAWHMRRRADVPVTVLATSYSVSFEHVIQLESKFFSDYGAVLSYCSVGLSASEHEILGFTSIHALVPHGLDRVVLFELAAALTFAELVRMGMSADVLRQHGLLNATDLARLRAPDSVDETARALRISPAAIRVARPPQEPAPPPAPRPEQRPPPRARRGHARASDDDDGGQHEQMEYFARVEDIRASLQRDEEERARREMDDILRKVFKH
jgi:hypothetical protein